MCCDLPLGSILLVGAILLTGSCSKAPTNIVDRIAILPLENLTAESSLDWIPAASQNTLLRQLTGIGKAVPIAAPNTREARLQGADRAVEGYLSGDSNVLRIHAVIEDLKHLKAASEIDITGPRQKGVLPMLDQLAKAVNPDARPFSTSNANAFERIQES